MYLCVYTYISLFLSFIYLCITFWMCVCVCVCVCMCVCYRFSVSYIALCKCALRAVYLLYCACNDKHTVADLDALWYLFANKFRKREKNMSIEKNWKNISREAFTYKYFYKKYIYINKIEKIHRFFMINLKSTSPILINYNFGPIISLSHSK